MRANLDGKDCLILLLVAGSIGCLLLGREGASTLGWMAVAVLVLL